MSNTPITILLDDCASSAKAPSSRLLTDPIEYWQAHKAEEIHSALDSIDHAKKSGQNIVALFSYELGEHLQGLRPRRSDAPLIEAFAFDHCETLSSDEVTEWIESQLHTLKKDDQPSGIINLKSSVSQECYARDITRVKELIARGETYQVNYTFRLSGEIFGHPLALYRELRQRQPVRYGTYIDTGSRNVLSFSPELFLKIKGEAIIAKPMKGTRKAERGNAEELVANAKDRAENLMITDLIRNDLGRICDIGSIIVPELFAVERIGNVYQMTSTVTGRLAQNLNLSELLLATFPCGSITGAPKRHTMEIIQQLEPQPRNLYCGSIGWFDPNGDCQMNVAIRTLEVDEKNRFEMGVGSGITADSHSDSEWQECMTKSSFITSLPSSVGLIETMRAQENKIPFLEDHLRRLSRSASALRISLNLDEIHSQIRSIAASLTSDPHMVRLQLDPDAKFSAQVSQIADLSGPQEFFWADDLLGTYALMKSGDPLLAHKTTHRAVYDAGWKAAVAKGGFDAIFTNERGEVTEGGRSSIFALIGGKWRTPALECGVLPGVMRAKILKDPVWGAEEAILYPKDIKNAERVILVNALRGVIEINQSAM